MENIIETKTAEVPATSFHSNSIEVPDSVIAQIAGNRIEQLSRRATTWHDTVFVTSNDMLYAILQDCYAYYEAICSGGEPGKVLKAELDAQFKKRVGGEAPKNDHTLTVIVKCVFGYNANNRKRISGYSIALRAALEDKQKSSSVAQYIKSKGGIEELRLGTAKSGLSNQDKVEAAKAAVSNNTLATISDAAVTADLDKAKTGQLVVLIAEQLPNGELSVKATIEKQSIVEAVLASYYSTIRKQIEENKQTEQTVSNSDRIDEMANAAVEEAEEKLAA